VIVLPFRDNKKKMNQENNSAISEASGRITRKEDRRSCGEFDRSKCLATAVSYLLVRDGKKVGKANLDEGSKTARYSWFSGENAEK